MSITDREFDIIVFGATGFTGQLCLKYLAETQHRNQIKWAIGGRSKEKLEAVLQKESITVPIFLADSHDEEALRKLASATKVVISLVGPYLLYGQTLVKVCAELGTSYCDLTGETPFSAKMTQLYTRAAISSRALIVHSTGFDSVPSDLNTFLAVQKLKSLGTNVKIGKVVSSFTMKGGPSGGTIATMVNMMGDKSSENQAINSNPFALSPIPGNHKVSPFLSQAVTYEGKTSYGAFFVMGPGNTALVRRTWGIFETSDASSRIYSYGPDFEYEECIAVSGRISAMIISLALYFGYALLMFFPPARWLLGKYGPQPSEGPSVETQINGSFSTVTIAKSVDEKLVSRVILKGKGDPGYFLTAKMIVECALAIVKDFDRLPPLAKSGGFLTPATAFGHVLVERLEATGHFSFSQS